MPQVTKVKKPKATTRKKAPKVYRPSTVPGKAHTERVKTVSKGRTAGEPTKGTGSPGWGKKKKK
jgi:hypothetical protein